MLILAMLFIVGLMIDAPGLYWIFWGISISIEVIGIINSIYFENDGEDDTQ